MPTESKSKRAAVRAVKPGERAPKAAPILTGRALELFKELSPDLETSGRLKPEYVPLFRLYCLSLSIAEKAGGELKDVEARGRKDSRVADPKFRGFREATALAFQLGREYGLTPASASAVKVPVTPDEEARKLLA